MENVKELLEGLARAFPTREGQNHGVVLLPEGLAVTLWVRGSQRLVYIEPEDVSKPGAQLASEIVAYVERLLGMQPGTERLRSTKRVVEENTGPVEDEDILYWAREYECVAGALPTNVSFRALVHERDALRAKCKSLEELLEKMYGKRRR